MPVEQELLLAARAIAAILIPISGLVAIVGIVASFKIGATIHSTAGWKLAKGKLLECRVIKPDARTRASLTRVGLSRLAWADSYQVTIHYEYKVDGVTYTGHQFRLKHFQVDVSSLGEGERLAAKFKAMPELEVYYDP